MTNNEIIIWINNNIDIKKFINRVIDNDNGDDLSQYIYLTLLEYDNKNLNLLYEKKVLPQFIMKIILNQRNYYRSYYNVYLKYNDQLYEEDIEDIFENNEDREKKLNFINKELCKYIGRRKNLTREQEYEMLCYEVYRLLIKRNYTIKELSERLKLNYRTTLRLIKYTKENIKEKFNSTHRN